MLTLDQLTPGCRAIVTALNVDHDVLPRLAVFGLALGEAIQLSYRAPLGGPLVLRSGTTCFLLRRTLAKAIQVSCA